MNIIEMTQDAAAEHLSLLLPIDQCWQPTDFLPDLTAEDWHDQLSRFRATAEAVPDDLLVILVGNMVTEEALPNYSITLEHITKDPTGRADDTPWAAWLRGWTAEENRHGDLLNAYLRLTGRVNIRSVERTIHHLIANGFTPDTDNDSCTGLIYAAFQERATRISHGNLGKLVAAQGDENLAKICRKIAADETRHELFYTRIIEQLFDQTPEETLLAYRTMLRRLVAMPGSRMTDGHDHNLFEHFANVAQRSGVYTSRDYASIIRHLNTAWDLEHRSFSGKSAKMQDYLCRQPERYEYLADEIEARAAEQPPVPFSWIHGRTAPRGNA